MTTTAINPPGLVEPQGYVHVTVATGTRTVHLSGQVGQDATGTVVGVGDLAAQAEQALLNVAVALEAAGAGFADVAKTTIYVKGLEPAMMPALFEGMQRGAERAGGQALCATTLVGVQSLADPDLLIELDVTAVVD